MKLVHIVLVHAALVHAALVHPVQGAQCLLYCVLHLETSYAAADVKVLGFFGEPGVQVLHVCTEDTPYPLVVTYNSTSLQHRVWAVLPAGTEVGEGGERREGGEGGTSLQHRVWAGTEVAEGGEGRTSLQHHVWAGLYQLALR